jgi:hypothetical protein
MKSDVTKYFATIGRSIRQIIQAVAVVSPLKLVHPTKIWRGGKTLLIVTWTIPSTPAMGNGGVAPVTVLYVLEVRTHLKNRE